MFKQRNMRKIISLLLIAGIVLASTSEYAVIVHADDIPDADSAFSDEEENNPEEIEESAGDEAVLYDSAAGDDPEDTGTAGDGESSDDAGTADDSENPEEPGTAGGSEPTEEQETQEVSEDSINWETLDGEDSGGDAGDTDGRGAADDLKNQGDLESPEEKEAAGDSEVEAEDPENAEVLQNQILQAPQAIQAIQPITTSDDLRSGIQAPFKVFHLDAGRKFFSTEDICDIIDALEKDDYTHLELAVGNDGLRFLLNDMSLSYEVLTEEGESLESVEQVYSNDEVTNAIRQGNLSYNATKGYNPARNELNEGEMDAIISYANSHNIEIIPMLNTPGHMDAIIYAMKTLGIDNPGLGDLVTSLDAENEEARSFTIALLEKYMAYFSSKGCKLFNLACDEYGDWTGFQTLIDQGNYDLFANYVNELASISRSYGMNPIAFNDGFYYGGSSPETLEFDRGILIAYWNDGWNGYNLASARTLEDKGFLILNTNAAWYYVLGNQTGFNYAASQNGMRTKSYRDVDGTGEMSADTVMGCMFAVWCDSPEYDYNDAEKERVLSLIHLMAQRHSGIFHPKADFSEAVITLDKEFFDYTGNEIKPRVEVRIEDNLLTEGVDYELEYENNIEVGRGKAIISSVSGNEQYIGTAEKGFVIRGERKRVIPVTSEDDFNNGWKFHYGDMSGAEKLGFSDSSWETVQVPHDYSSYMDFTTSGTEGESGFLPAGVGWYRKHFTLDESASGKSVQIHFGGVYMNATVYINGTKLGTHPYGYTPFSFDISEYVKTDGTDNVIAVKVDHKLPSSRWYSGSGILRPVELTIQNRIHIPKYGVVTENPNLAAEAGSAVNTEIHTTVVNESGEKKSFILSQVLYDDNYQEVNGTEKAFSIGGNDRVVIDQVLPVSGIRLWSPESPSCYYLRTDIVSGGEVLDTYWTEMGYRFYDFDVNTGFSLNGRAMKLQGVCMHSDYGVLGTAENRTAMVRQLEILKDLGVNAIRTSHNPASEEFLHLCNELGFIVIEEAFDMWDISKNGNSEAYSKWFGKTIESDSKIISGESGMTWAEFDIKQMVRRSVNAPSVIMYSLGNELYVGLDGGNPNERYLNIANNLVSWLNDVRTDQRITIAESWYETVMNNGDTTHNQINDLLVANNGAVGLNYATNNPYDQLHSRHPNWPLYASEIGSTVSSRDYYRSWQQNANDRQVNGYGYDAPSWGKSPWDAWRDIITRDFVAGGFVWTGFDYIGEPTPWTWGTNGNPYPKSSYFGMVDTAGIPKDVYYFYRSQWNHESTTLHIAPYWENDIVVKNTVGVEVLVFTNADAVELFLEVEATGETVSLGKKSMTTHTTSEGYRYKTTGGVNDPMFLRWDVPYQKGTLKAVACDASGNIIENTVGRHETSTVGKAKEIRLTPYKGSVTADGKEVAFIVAEAVDEEGRTVPHAVDEIYFDVDGNGFIIATDNGDPTDTTNMKSDIRRLFFGKAVVMVQTDGEAGEIKIRAFSPDLEEAEVSITAVSGNAVSRPVYEVTEVPEPIKYSITFTDEGGKALQKLEVTEGEIPKYTGATPTKGTTAEYTYAFSGWSPAVTAASKDATYKATFKGTKRSYTVTFDDGFGKTLKKQSVVYGGKATAPTNPSKSGYSFVKWNKTFSSITGNTTITAVWNKQVAVPKATNRIYNGKSQVGVAAGTGYTVSGGSATNAGTYKATVTPKANYCWTDGTRTAKTISYTVKKVTLTATYKSETIDWYGTPKMTVTVTGFVNGETAKTAANYKAPSAKKPKFEAHKSYSVTPSGGSAKNYSFKYVKGTLTVKGKDVLILSSTAGKNKINLKWTKVPGATGYKIYGSLCNSKGVKYTPSLKKTIKGSDTLKYTISGVKAGEYKYYVIAYKAVNGKNITLAKSELIHITLGNKKYTNVTKVTVNKDKLTLKKGKTATIKAKIKYDTKYKALAHDNAIRYISTDTYIATVDGNGKIVAKGKGTCKIYVVANSGVWAIVTVTVK